jgi:formyltetrahydrofolate deformylase
MTATAVAGRAAGQGVLMLSCPDTPGIVFAVAGFLVERQCTIVQSQQFDDPDSGTFFMRVQLARCRCPPCAATSNGSRPGSG